jgi:hypothetical protein
VIRARDLALWLEVREEREVKVAILRESEVGPHAVNRDTDELRAEPLKLGQQLL